MAHNSKVQVNSVPVVGLLLNCFQGMLMNLNKILIIAFISILVPLTSFAQEKNSIDSGELTVIESWKYRGLRPIGKFSQIDVRFHGSAEKVGLHMVKLTDYARVRFGDIFEGVKYENLSTMDKSGSNTIEEEPEKNGILIFNIWTEGRGYQIAYFVECRGGSFKNIDIWSLRHLGVSSPKSVRSDVQESINECIADFAEIFFAIKGEL